MPSSERGSADSGAGDQGGTDIRLGDRSVVRLFADDRRIRVGLVMPVLDRVVDITVQPSAACGALDDEGRRLGLAPQAVEATARRVIDEVAERSEARRPVADQCLKRAFGGAAFPLLGGSYDLGGQPVAEIPRWAAPALSQTTVGAGATEAFGAKATRPVKRALVAALAPLPSGEIDLTVLALALMGVDALEPDRLARVLQAPRVLQPANHLPDPTTLREVRATLARWGSARSERVLLDAAERPDGARLLITTARYAQQLAPVHGPPSPLPNNLADLHAAHRALLRGAPAAPPPIPRPGSSLSSVGTWPQPRRLAEFRAPPEPVRPPQAQAQPQPGRGAAAVPAPAPADAPIEDRADAIRLLLQAPPIRFPPRTENITLSPGHRLTVPPHIRRLDGLYFGDLSFAIPATVGDLVTWSQVLSNCLDSFGPAVATGRSIILGITRLNRLTYVLELDPNKRIRQFTGAANRPPATADRLAVARQLESHGAIDARDSANHVWLTDPTDQTA